MYEQSCSNSSGVENKFEVWHVTQPQKASGLKEPL